ncbi:unnamed protein product [Allacma fusca]|uniref:Uncharacterized protein n=1 Tax=Allacma fusca TaxID=39272 RepID=A0A8J2LIS2_9HEXA|nr:unnamed protein product [Allacma fusca]
MARPSVIFTFLVLSFGKVYPQEGNITVSEVVQNFTAAENELYPSSLFNVKDVTINDLTPDLDTWESPQWMQVNYPYYLAGYDYDDRPVWVVEMGKYQMRKLVERGPEALKNFTKYCVQAAKIIIKSHKDRNPDGNRASFILDFDGLRFEQFAHIPSKSHRSSEF